MTYEALRRVQFRDWTFHVRESHGQDYLQVEFLAPDLTEYTGGVSHIEFTPQRGRKWLLSPHMTDGEVVQTAWKAVLTALEHEAREEFKYKDATIFGPHFDLEALVEVCRRGATLMRTETR